MFENKFFIKKPNGIKQSAISKNIQVILLFIALGIGMLYGPNNIVLADNVAENQSFSQNFNNSNSTVSGRSVHYDVFFTKMNYWNIDQGQINFNFKISQLTDNDVSDLTLSINGVKFYSFRPDSTSDLQRKTIDIPTDLIQDSNHLQISGQIINQVDDQTVIAETPANWLTVYQDSNINLNYSLTDATEKINEFYAHFTGMDTVLNQKSAIQINPELTDPEIEANLYALTGLDRVLSNKGKIPLISSNDTSIDNYNYQIIIAKQGHLPKRFKNIGADLDQDHAVIQTIIQQNRHYLIVTAKNQKQLIKASRFIANPELMNETQQAKKKTSTNTQTFIATSQSKNIQNITQTETYLSGAGHHEATYSLSMPVNQNNANGSKIKLHTKYAKNIDFKNSLISVEIDDKKIGSHQLTAQKADDDTFEVKIPNGQSLSRNFNLKVTFDLVNKYSSLNSNPWAVIEPQSTISIKSEPMNNLLFDNYPSTFIKNKTFDNIALIRPEKINSFYLDTLASLFYGIGNYAEQNTGNITIYQKTPNKSQLANSSIIAFGTPNDNEFIKKANNDLYFKFDNNFQNIISNEKMSLENKYSQTIGIAQLLRSPYNQKRSLLILTAIHDSDVAMAANQISSQDSLAQIHGDAIIIDQNNHKQTYRFKKDTAANARLDLDLKLKRNHKLIVYILIFIFILISLIGSAIMILHKNGKLALGRNSDER